MRAGPPISDLVAGAYAAMGICAAIVLIVGIYPQGFARIGELDPLLPDTRLLQRQIMPIDRDTEDSYVLPVDVDFKPAIYSRLVSVPRGGTASGIAPRRASRTWRGTDAASFTRPCGRACRDSSCCACANHAPC